MIEHLRITVLVENTAGAPGLQGEHGLALWVEADDHCLLFDTGQGPALVPNAGTLGIDLSRAEAVVLSHGHYDHTGGLRQVLALAPHARVFAHPQVVGPHYSRRGATARAIGMDAQTAAELQAAPARVVWTPRATEVYPDVFATGAIPRRTAYEDVGGAFYLDEACRQPDPIADDQALCLLHRRGMIVLLGCAHAGVVNTLEYVRGLTGIPPLHAVMGGLHLLHAVPERLAATVAALRAFDLKQLAPAHCTGAGPTAALAAAFPEPFTPVSVGARLEFA